MWWAYTRGGLYSGGGLIVGGLRYYKLNRNFQNGSYPFCGSLLTKK